MENRPMGEVGWSVLHCRVYIFHCPSNIDHPKETPSVGKGMKREDTVAQDVAPAPRAKSMVREYAEALIIAVLLALVIRTFVVQAFKIPSGSMLPTLQIGDHILVNKFVYYFQSIQRGDVIVFKFPQD